MRKASKLFASINFSEILKNRKMAKFYLRENLFTWENYSFDSFRIEYILTKLALSELIIVMVFYYFDSILVENCLFFSGNLNNEIIQQSPYWPHESILRKKCPYLEIFWSWLSWIWTEQGYLFSKYPFSVIIWENNDIKTRNRDILNCKVQINLKLHNLWFVLIPI